ncbi:MAG: hypothetical protein EON87_04425 [Brevundimonas sp.]|nr:MAG: hypothetical protein EON87_04425 [Brevundimonas sp.]
MARKTIYCAQPFWLRAGRLAGGEVHQFLNEERAREGAEVLMTGADGVAVFSVEGHPDEDLWEGPRMIVSYGAVPPLEVAA